MLIDGRCSQFIPLIANAVSIIVTSLSSLCGVARIHVRACTPMRTFVRKHKATRAKCARFAKWSPNKHDRGMIVYDRLRHRECIMSAFTSPILFFLFPKRFFGKSKSLVRFRQADSNQSSVTAIFCLRAILDLETSLSIVLTRSAWTTLCSMLSYFSTELLDEGRSDVESRASSYDFPLCDFNRDAPTF